MSVSSRYIGAFWWRYKLPDGRNGTIHLDRPTGNLNEDSGFVRYLVRKELKLKRLPNGTTVTPKEPIS